MRRFDSDPRLQPFLIIFNHIVKPHSGHRTDLPASRFKFADVFEDVAIFERPHFYDCSRLHES